MNVFFKIGKKGYVMAIEEADRYEEHFKLEFILNVLEWVNLMKFVKDTEISYSNLHVLTKQRKKQESTRDCRMSSVRAISNVLKKKSIFSTEGNMQKFLHIEYIKEGLFIYNIDALMQITGLRRNTIKSMKRGWDKDYRQAEVATITNLILGE